MDPSGPFDFQKLIAEASTESESSLSFTFNQNRKIQEHSTTMTSVYPDYLSLIPYELLFIILEMLPSQSALNLFIASPHFRQCARSLPRSFWKYRLFFDVPWCADMVLSEIQQRIEVNWSELFRLLKEESAIKGYDGDALDYLGLKNRRRIWLNCERIIKDMESQHALKR